MHDDQDPDRLAQALRRAADAYHQPPPTPRRELWLQVQQARAIRQRPRPSWAPPHPLAWTAGIAAVLAIGIGLGRLSVAKPAGPAVPAVAGNDTGTDDNAPTQTADVYRILMTEHLGQAEAFLTLFRFSVQRGTVDPLASSTARQLLTTDRLLLDSPAVTDRSTRLLLEDLELVLARIVQIVPEAKAEDLKLIVASMERSDVMTRLRSEVPAGAGLANTQGVM